VNAGFLPVIGLRDVIYHMAVSSRKRRQSVCFVVCRLMLYGMLAAIAVKLYM